jgi:hypothetical protein
LDKNKYYSISINYKYYFSIKGKTDFFAKTGLGFWDIVPYTNFGIGLNNYLISHLGLFLSVNYDLSLSNFELSERNKFLNGIFYINLGLCF